MLKLTEEDKKFINSMPIEEIIRLHDELGYSFECNDGKITNIDAEKVA